MQVLHFVMNKVLAVRKTPPFSRALLARIGQALLPFTVIGSQSYSFPTTLER